LPRHLYVTSCAFSLASRYLRAARQEVPLERSETEIGRLIVDLQLVEAPSRSEAGGVLSSLDKSAL
jgi:hypothetical protein